MDADGAPCQCGGSRGSGGPWSATLFLPRAAAPHSCRARAVLPHAARPPLPAAPLYSACAPSTRARAASPRARRCLAPCAPCHRPARAVAGIRAGSTLRGGRGAGRGPPGGGCQEERDTAVGEDDAGVGEAPPPVWGKEPPGWGRRMPG
jgi:hypothetical protein